MADGEPVPSSPEVEVRRAAGFGRAAAHDERARPGPLMDALGGRLDTNGTPLEIGLPADVGKSRRYG